MDKKSLAVGLAVGVAAVIGVMSAKGAGPNRDTGGGAGCTCGNAAPVDTATYRMVVIGDRFAVVLNTQNGTGKVVDVQRSGNF